jgi:hypothetical protein
LRTKAITDCAESSPFSHSKPRASPSHCDSAGCAACRCFRSRRDAGAAYRDPGRWFRSVVLNTAGMGFFSSDRTIRQYDAEIWRSSPWLHEATE